MKWNGDISKINPKAGEVIIVEGCSPEMFRDSEAIRAMFPDNLVLLFSPVQSIKSADERMMKRLGWVRDKKQAEPTIPGPDPECSKMFPTMRAKDAHYRSAHTEAGQARIKKMHAARKKKA